LNNIYSSKVYENKGNPDVLGEVPEYVKTILDIGCGAGDNAKILKALGKTVVGLTISESEAKIAEAFCDRVIIDDIENISLLKDEKFDCILMSHICEHLINPEKVLINIGKYLNENGRLIIAVPNMAYYKLRFRLLKGDWKMKETGPFDRTHLHFYSYYSIDTLYSNSDYKVISKIPGDPSVPLFLFRRIFKKLAKKIDKHFGKRFPNLFSIQVVIVLEKIRNFKF
jgi:SAM-dependent methyltransferase